MPKDENNGLTEGVRLPAAYLKPEHLPAAISFIRALERLIPGSHLHVSDGWSSPKMPKIAVAKVFALQPIVQIVEFQLATVSPGNQHQVVLWANILRRGQRVDWHDHVHTSDGPNDWSGVVYLTAGSDLEFREGGGTQHANEKQPPGGLVSQKPDLVSPKPGLAIIFPAWRRHRVHPQGPGERISVAWNARRIL